MKKWESTNLGTIIGRLNAGVSVNSEDRPARDGEIGILKTSCVTGGIFRPYENKRVVNREKSRVRVSPERGGIIISRMNTSALVGASAYVEEDLPNLFLPDRLWQAMVSDKKRYSARWLSYLLSSDHMRMLLMERAAGTSGSMKNLSKSSLLAIRVSCPPYAEQVEITKILTSWDRAIALSEHLFASKREIRPWLAQQLLTGKRRLPGFTKRWRTVHLGEVLTNRVETNPGDLPLVAITGGNGVVSRDDLVRRDTSPDDKGRYLRICPGDIGYNTMRMWQGVCGFSRLEGIVSPAYTVVTPTGAVDGEFMALLFKAPPVFHLFHRHSQGLVDDTLNLKYRNFAKIKVTIPAKEEQLAIAAIFRVADRELDLLCARVVALREQKKGLMQQLLTGKRRLTAQSEVRA